MCLRCGVVFVFYYFISDVFYVWFCRFFFEFVGEYVMVNVFLRICNYIMVFWMGFEKFCYFICDYYYGD